MTTRRVAMVFDTLIRAEGVTDVPRRSTLFFNEKNLGYLHLSNMEVAGQFWDRDFNITALRAIIQVPDRLRPLAERGMTFELSVERCCQLSGRLPALSTTLPLDEPITVPAHRIFDVVLTWTDEKDLVIFNADPGFKSVVFEIWGVEIRES